MNDEQKRKSEPKAEDLWAEFWEKELGDIADKKLGNPDLYGPSHPLIDRWFGEYLLEYCRKADLEIPHSVNKAVTYLATEIYNVAPQAILELTANGHEQSQLIQWLKRVLILGQRFQMALDAGVFDDL